MTNNPNNSPDALQRRANIVELEGRHRFGENGWAAAMGALTRANPQGLDPQDAAKLMNSPNACDQVWARGMDALIAQGDSDREAAVAYSEIRAAQREQHRRLKGRG